MQKEQVLFLFQNVFITFTVILQYLIGEVLFS